MARRRLWSASVGVLWLAAPLAAEARQPVLVLDPESSFHSPEQLQAIGKEMRAFTATRPDILPTPVFDRQSLEQLTGCLTSSPGCLQALGREARARRVLFTQVQKVPGRHLLILRLIDVQTGRALKELRERTSESPDAILDSYKKSLTELFGEVLPCRLEVTANVDGAAVSIDGQPAGKTPATLQVKLVAGRHRIRVTHPEHQPSEKVVVLRPGEPNLRVKLALKPKAQSAVAKGADKSKAPSAAVEGVKVKAAEDETALAEAAADRTMPMEEKPCENEPGLGATPACAPPERPTYLPGSAASPELPIHKKWWFWTSIGAVVVVSVITGTVIGLSGAEESPASRARVIVEF